jgi:hypothetical protein
MHKPRILAVDLRPQRFGFAVLEGIKILVDSGIKSISGSGNDADLLQKRIRPLLILYLPSVVVVNLGSDSRRSSRVRSAKLLETLRAAAEEYAAELVILERSDIRRAFRQSGNKSKDEIAGFIAGLFPDVGWKLPPKRENWQAEHHSITMFDAISAGLTYFVQQGYALPSNPEYSHARDPG